MKKLLAVGAVLVCTAAIAPAADATSGARAAPSGTTLVRVAHLSPDTAGVDVWVDGQRALRNVAYKTVSDYQALPAGQHRLELRPFDAPATAKAILSADTMLPSDTAHTVAGVGLHKDLHGAIFEDDLSVPPTGMAKVRFIHAAVGVGKVDGILSGGATLGTGIGFGFASKYALVGPGTFDVELRAARRGTVLTTVPGIDLGPGLIYSFVAIGGGGTPLQFIPVVDGRAPAATPIGPAKTGAGGTACVRAHHRRHVHSHHRGHEHVHHRVRAPVARRCGV